MVIRQSGPASSLALGTLGQCQTHPVTLDGEATPEPRVTTRPSRGHCSSQPGAHSPETYRAGSGHGGAGGAGRTRSTSKARGSCAGSCACSVSAPPIAANSNAGGVAASRPPQLKEKSPRFLTADRKWACSTVVTLSSSNSTDELTRRAAKSLRSPSHLPSET